MPTGRNGPNSSSVVTDARVVTTVTAVAAEVTGVAVVAEEGMTDAVVGVMIVARETVTVEIAETEVTGETETVVETTPTMVAENVVAAAVMVEGRLVDSTESVELARLVVAAKS